VARTVVALASHGISYTFGQVLDMTGDDLAALTTVLDERAAEQAREQAMEESRAKAQGGLTRRR
jgi:hypothetical protein